MRYGHAGSVCRIAYHEARHGFQNRKMRYLIGRYHEVALKGGNRWRFVDQVKHNLRAIFGDFELGRARSLGSRLLIELPDAISDEVVRERAALIFGLQNFSI